MGILKTTILKIGILFSIFVLSYSSFGQNDLSVISTVGDYAETSSLKVNSIVGEIFVSTGTTNEVIVTQGFNQAFFVISTLENNQTPETTLKIFPNPATDFFNIELKEVSSEKLTYYLFDISGQLITSKVISSTLERVELEGLSNQTYFLKVLDENQLLQSFKIQKLK